MARAGKCYKNRYHGDGFTVEWDTAYDLGYAVGEHGLRMSNPFDPSTNDYDDFFDGLEQAKNQELPHPKQ